MNKKRNIKERILGVFGGGIYAKAEENACKLLNSNKINHKWKKDFVIDRSTEDWDLVNSEKKKIEVKSTIQNYSFSKNYSKLNTPNQHKQIIIKLLINNKGKILKYKFVKLNNGKWEDITQEILK